MADSEKEVSYAISADASQFLRGMQNAAKGAESAANTITKQFSEVGEAFESVMKTLGAMAAIVAGGKFFKEAINETIHLTEESKNLARVLAISSEEASTLNTALDDIGSSGETYTDAFQKFARQLKNNEDGINNLGLKTRDANGNFKNSRELFAEGLGIIGQYKEGIDKNIVAQTLFGKSVDEVLKLQKLYHIEVRDGKSIWVENNELLKEARQKNEELGLTITKQNEEAAKSYGLAMNDVGDVFKAINKVIGDAVMPLFTELGEYFARTGPYVVGLFKGAIYTLLGAFEYLKGAVKTVSGVIFESISLIIDGAGMLGEVFTKLLSGDFQGSYNAAKGLGNRIGAAFVGSFNNFIEAGDEVDKGIQALYDRMYNADKKSSQPRGGTNTVGNTNNINGKGKDTSRMQLWETELSEEKLKFQERMNIQGSLERYSKESEQKFWADKLRITVAGSNENLSVRRKYAELELSLGSEKYQAQIAELEKQAASERAGSTERIAILQKEVALAVQAFGAKSKEAEEAGKKVVSAQKEAADLTYRYEIAKLDTLASESRNGSIEKISILEQELQLAKNVYGKESIQYEEIQKKIVSAKRDASAQLMEIELLRSQELRNIKMDELKANESQLKFILNLGLINQQEYLTRIEEFENMRYKISMDGIMERQLLAQGDPLTSPVMLEQINMQKEQAEREHQSRLTDIRRDAIINSQAATIGIVNSLGSGFQNVFAQFLQGTTTIQKALQGLWQSITQAVTNSIAKIAADYLMMAIKNKILGKVMASSAVSEKSAEAGAGGVASMAAAPFPLNLSAPAFGASMAAASMAFMPLVSAAGGYDIPGSINPIVQTHAREMILPQRYADVIRGLGNGENGGNTGDTINFNLQAVDARHVHSLLKDNQSALIEIIKQSKRNFSI